MFVFKLLEELEFNKQTRAFLSSSCSTISGTRNIPRDELAINVLSLHSSIAQVAQLALRPTGDDRCQPYRDSASRRWRHLLDIVRTREYFVRYGSANGDRSGYGASCYDY